MLKDLQQHLDDGFTLAIVLGGVQPLVQSCDEFGTRIVPIEARYRSRSDTRRCFDRLWPRRRTADQQARVERHALQRAPERLQARLLIAVRAFERRGLGCGLSGRRRSARSGEHHRVLACKRNPLFLRAHAPVGDAAELALATTASSFRVGFQIAMPVIAAGLIFRVGLGVLSRLIPTIQVFFVALPLQMMGGFVVFALGLSAGMLIWLDSLEQYATWLR